jgi:hypothetical protein
MGLLDDAIREHLELKRRRGADPGEIAHQERAALEPSPPALRDAHEAHAEADSDVMIEQHGEAAEALEQHASTTATVAEGEEPGFTEIARPGQETAELDMRAVMAEGPHEEANAAAAEPPAGPHADAGAPAEDESLDWEFPEHEAREHHPEPTPGQERLSFE